MKKVLLGAMVALSTMTLSAQGDVLKDINNQLKGKDPDYAAILNKLNPILQNPETSKNVEAWVLAGKANIAQYDNLFKRSAIGQQVDFPLMGKSLIDGISDYMTALPLDSMPDDKGKIKAKYSKDIIKQIKDNYNSLNSVAVTLYNAKDYMGAYNAWNMYLDIPYNPVLGVNAPKAQADSTQSDIAFNMGIAAWQGDSLPLSLAAFERAIALGYNKKQVYDYAISVAAQLHNDDKITELATKAYPIYGNEDPKFLQLMINSKIQKEQYDEARQMLQDAINDTPDNAQLYYVRGILEDNLDNVDAALADYKKAVQLDSKFAPALYMLGRTLCNVAYKLDDQIQQGKSQTEYMKLRESEVNPLFREAATYLEEAYKLDPDNQHDALKYLRNVYYNLNDEENLKRVESL